MDVQNHSSLVSDLGNTKKQVACGKHRTPKSSGLFATEHPHALSRLVIVGVGRGVHDLLAFFRIKNR